MNPHLDLDASSLLQRVAERVPPALRANVVVIGSIATAWAFRDVSGTHSVATKDIDLLLRPAIDAVGTAETLGQELLNEGWQPQYPTGIQPGTADTPDDRLPALRLSPPGDTDGWFVELLAEPPAEQATRKHWRRFQTELGDFGLPSFRYMRVAVHGAEDTEFGLRVARPARMALAHLLEHADPDPNVSLRSFIVSVTPAAEMALHWNASREQMAERNILFDEDDGYVEKLVTSFPPA